MSRASALLELVAELARRHDAAVGDQLTVIPVLVDDLGRAEPVLHALCAVTDGRLFASSDTDLNGPVTVTKFSNRRSAISAELNGQPTSNRHVDVKDVGGDLVDVSFEDPPSGSVPSRGEYEILAVARAILSQKLDSYPLAVITYNENVIDREFKRSILALVTGKINGVQHPTLRTLIFAAEGSISATLHCEPGRGVRFAVDGHRLLRRKGLDDLRVKAGLISSRKEPVVFLLGAGFSASSKMPLGNALRDDAIRRVLNISPVDAASLGSSGLEKSYYQWIIDQGQDWLTRREREMTPNDYMQQLTLEQVMRSQQRLYPDLPTLQEFRRHHDSVVANPGSAVKDLIGLLDHAEGRVVLITLNFDLLIEQHARVKLRVFASQDEFRDAAEYLLRYLAGDETEIPLLKLHGTIADPNTCVVTMDQTERGIGMDKLAALKVLLGEPTNPRLWVYVGASMRDVDLNPVLQGEEFGRGLSEYWVIPHLPETVEEFARPREPMWKETGLQTVEHRLITETADTFFEALRNAWDPTV